MAKNFLRKAAKSILVGCNVAIALFLLISCYGSNLNQDRFWFTGIFTLASFYLLVILIVFLFFWLFVKPRLSFISLIAIIGCWKPLQQVVRPQISHNFIMKKDPVAVRVMSWNVAHFDIIEHKTHPEKKQQMLAAIKELNPDVACFQEMVASDSAPNAINDLADFKEKLQMPYTHYAYNPKLDFDAKHRFGIIIFSKYPIINRQMISYAPRDYNSIFQFADIVKGTDTIRVFNIHLQSLKFSRDNRRYLEDPTLNDEADLEKSKTVLAKLRIGFKKRKVQSERIQKAIGESKYPVIVCGDFNDVPNSYAYNCIGQGLTNAFAAKGAGIGSTFDGISPTLRIDNIFAGPPFKVQQYLRTRKKLSDHFPITADLVLSAPANP